MDSLNREELKLLHIPFLSLFVIPIGYLGMAFYSGNQYEFLVSLIFQICFALVFLVVTNSLFLVIYYIIEKPFSVPLMLVILYNTVILPIVFLKFTRIEWTSTGWEVMYTPNYMFILAGLGMIVFILGVDVLLFELFRSAPYKDLWILFSLVNISGLIALALLVFRQSLGIPSNLWTVGFAVMWLLFSLIVIRRPRIFLTSSEVPMFLMILNKNTGTPIKLYHFVENEMETTDETLFSGAITAVQSVIEESVESSDRISYIGLDELHLEIINKDQFEFILASKNPSSALRSILKDIASDWDFDLIDGTITNETETKIQQIIHKNFVHQIRRLDLFLDQIQI